MELHYVHAADLPVDTAQLFMSRDLEDNTLFGTESEQQFELRPAFLFGYFCKVMFLHNSPHMYSPHSIKGYRHYLQYDWLDQLL